ncbi:hypothetical protein THMIRHAM_22330 [Thiomicrorhabdus immobilis]|uniref:Lipoprotein n=1 Tax=Thiomicrorhabdus immobilis TaxID=2791037 RepID=A0ABN6CZD8_9GAMM|nr:hypothetical protein [Thiomicrorhabdus immobilis]BCN94448.1 hypothetical protein THMIRHAM_22330 [Thiomicrorhabdus immobilis]
MQITLFNKRLLSYKAYIFPLIMISLAGCSSMPYSTNNMEIQPNDSFILKQAIEIAPNSARAYIQHGSANTGGFDHSEQHCRVEVTNLSEHKQVVLPETFQITSVNVDEEAIAQADLSGTQLAFNSTNNSQTDSMTFIGFLGLGMEQRPETMDLIHIYLKSKQQPNVYRLTCAGALSNGNPADAPRSYRPDLKAINRILGKIGEIKLNH